MAHATPRAIAARPVHFAEPSVDAGLAGLLADRCGFAAGEDRANGTVRHLARVRPLLEWRRLPCFPFICRSQCPLAWAELLTPFSYSS